MQDNLFHDDFESGDLSAWASAVSDEGDLSASQAADYWGDYGLLALIDDTNAIYVQDDTPDDENRYRARFYLHPNGVTLGSGEVLDLLTGYSSETQVLRLQLQYNGVDYQIRAGLLSDADAWSDTSWYTIQNKWTAVEIEWQAYANDGRLNLWLDGTLKQGLSKVDNDARLLGAVRLGAMGVDSGSSGALYFDDFEARRFSFIGTLPAPGIPDPEPTAQPSWLASAYTYQGAGPHAVTEVTHDDGQGLHTSDTCVYDDSGNPSLRFAPLRCTPFAALRCAQGKCSGQAGQALRAGYGYTRQRDLPALGLMDYKARFYDPRLGRFIQADTVVPAAANPQTAITKRERIQPVWVGP